MKWNTLKRLISILTATAAATFLAGTAAALNVISTRRTERRHPASGRLIDVGETRLHYIDQGDGPPVVLLHGDGLTAVDWRSSGIIDALAGTHRVIAFDRAGFGYSSRPRGQAWTPAAQAAILHEALHRLDVGPAIIVGHSWGALVALALALEYPPDCGRLLLISGYYFPTFRPEMALFGVPALRFAGDVLRYTVLPPLTRLLAPLLSAQVFAPAHVDEAFATQLAMAARPSQIWANAQEAALTIPSVAAMAHRYKDVRIPVAIVAGAGDKVVSPKQSERLADEIPESQLLVVPGAGHMVHYAANHTIVKSIAVMANAQAVNDERDTKNDDVKAAAREASQHDDTVV